MTVATASCGPRSRSFSVGDTDNVPLGIRVFGVGCHLTELIVGLRSEHDRESTPAATQRHIDQLNRDFANLRELLQGSDLSLAEALIAPVLERRLSDVRRVERLRQNNACFASRLGAAAQGRHIIMNNSRGECRVIRPSPHSALMEEDEP